MRMLLILSALLWAVPAAAQTQPRITAPESRASLRGMARPSSAALAAARRYLCPNGGTPQGRGRCARGSGPGLGMGFGTGMMGDDPSVRDWDQGIAPPTRAQAPCPPGTTASQARDQPNITRCVAG